MPLELSARQRTVVDALRRHDTERYPLSHWYLGALYAVENRYNPDRCSQAGQSLRELLEKLLRVVLEGNAQAQNRRPDFHGQRSRLYARITKDQRRYQNGWEGQGIDRQLARTLEEAATYFQQSQQQPSRRDQIQASVEHIDPLADQMDSTTRNRKRYEIVSLWQELEAFAHHRTSDEERFLRCLRTLERIVLDLLAPIIAQDQQEIQSILDSVNRSAEDMDRLFELIGRRGANYRYFFVHASDPSWISVLREREHFADPPNIDVSEDGRADRPPPWWPMRFLSRAATSAPDEVLAIIKELPESDNPQMHEGILDIALQLPDEQSAQLLTEVLRYARNSGRNLPHRLPDLLVHWTNEGQTTEALELSKRIIYFDPDPELEEKQARRRECPDDPTTVLWPSPRLESWHYQQAMERGVRSLIAAAPYRTAGILISAVDQLTRHQIHQDEIDAREGQDDSEVWYPKLRGPLDKVLRSSDALIHSMTLACERVWEDDPGSVADLDRRLRSEQWRIFQRLRQHLYAQRPDDQTKPWIREEILEHSDYGRRVHHYEFQQMIHASVGAFGDDLLTQDERRTIFDAILSGPDRESFRRFAGDDDTDELFEQSQRDFHRMQLRPFENILFGKYRDYFQDLESETGANIDDEDYLSVGAARSGSIRRRSPTSVESLASLEDEELLDYINTWDDERHDPDDWFVEITIDALSEAFGEVFRQAALSNPDRLNFWLDNRNRIERPIYVRRMIDAMNSRIEVQDFSDLDRWLEFCEWTLTHPDREREPSFLPSDQSRENPHWGECRRSVRDLLGNLVTVGSENNLILSEMAHDKFLTLMGKLCTEYDWRLDEDQKVFTGREDWGSEAINNTRSRALQDLLRYGRWLRKVEPDADVSGIREILELRFRSDAEFPLTLPERAILGLSYLDALAMDETWASEHKADFFPQNDTEHWIVSFGELLERHLPHRRIYEIFEYDFLLAVQILPEEAEHNPARASLLDVLGQLLLIYYVNDMFPLQGQDSPLEGYYQATGGQRQRWADLFEYAGRRLYHVEGELDDAVRERYEAFFEWRLDVGDPSELAKFDSWLEASCLSVEWRLDAYARALDVCQFDDSTFWHRWEPICEMIPEDTGGVVRCFAKLVDKFPTDYYITPEAAKQILRAGLGSEEQEVREISKRTLEVLLLNGQLDMSILDE